MFQGKPCDPWLGWPKELQLQRLPLIGNHTRFLILPTTQGWRNLGSSVLGANLPRLSADWQAEWGHLSLVAYRSGLPVASRSYQEEGGEPAAIRGLFEEVDLPGITVTLDAGHTSRETILALQEQHRADTLATIQGNAGLAYNLIAQDGNWASPEARRAAERWTPGHGRWERRELVPTAAVRDDGLPWPGVRQVFRVTHRTQRKRQGKVTAEVLYGFTSLSPEQAPPQRRQWHRGHWTVENRNHLPRDVSLGEDRSHIRTGHGPANNAALNNLALALLVRSGPTVPLAQSHFCACRDEALEALQAKQ